VTPTPPVAPPSTVRPPSAPPVPTPQPISTPPAGRHRRSVGERVRDRLRDLVEGTPGKLRVLGAATIVVSLLFGILSAVVVGIRSGEIADLRSDAAQLVLLQDARTNLVAADAAATNAFLVGGLEPAGTRQDYDDGIRLGAEALTASSVAAGDSDADELGKVTTALARYTGLVEAARANNRQGFPVGVAYLRQASDLMRSEVLPTLASLSEAADRRVADSYASSESAGLALWLIGIGAVVILAGAAAWLTQRTRRWVSVPLVVAMATIAGATLIAGAAMIYAQAEATDVRDGSYARSADLTQSRIDAFDAKSNESLGLINRGSGKSFEEQPGGFDDLMASATSTVPADPESLADTLDHYDEVHTNIRRLDDAGDWDAAVRLAVSPEPNGSNGAFAAFDDESARELSSATEQVDSDLAGARRPLGAARLVLVLAGLVAAVAAWQAFAERLREYR
jgi:hypothetical protein